MTTGAGGSELIVAEDETPPILTVTSLTGGCESVSGRADTRPQLGLSTVSNEEKNQSGGDPGEL